MTTVLPRATDARLEPAGDDLEAYVATFSDEERSALTTAEMAVDIAALLHRVRTARGLSQAEAAKCAGLHQQAVSRLERPHGSMRLDTLQVYLAALGYGLEINVVERSNGEVAASVAAPTRGT
jgi:DNA-binding phage protein